MPSQAQKWPQEVRKPVAASGELESRGHLEQASDEQGFRTLLDVLSQKYSELARRNSLLMKEVEILTAEGRFSGKMMPSSLLPTMEEDESYDFGIEPLDRVDSAMSGPIRTSSTLVASSKTSLDVPKTLNVHRGQNSASTTNSELLRQSGDFRMSAPMPGSQRLVRNNPSTSITNSSKFRQSEPRLSVPNRGSLEGAKSNSNKSSALMSRMAPLFPTWYDPEALSEETRESMNPLEDQAVMGLMTRNLEAKEGTAQKAKYVLSPVGIFRLFWDFIGMVCLLYECWSIPIALVFITTNGLPFAMFALDWALVAFFSLDIILNFRTGYIVADRIVWNPKLIVRNYLRAWFLIDTVATIPWDKIFLVLMTHAGDYTAVSLVRIVKISKAFKAIRFLRLAHATRLVKSMDVGANMHEFYAICSVFLNPVQVLAVFLVAAHMTGSIWAAALPHWKATDDTQDAFRMYYQSVWWAFMALTVGAVGGTHSGSDRPLLWSIDMLVAVERFCLIAWLFAYSSLRFAVNFQDRVLLLKAKADATNYLRKRDVSVATQIQVLFSIWETGQARIMRNRFEEIILGEVPTELQRTICEELWSGPLLSLGLIMHVSHWHEDLVSELALVAREEVFASKSIIFQEANAAIAAYYIIDGSISVFTSMSTHHIPDFTRGMWLGEKALVNPMLRRSGTAVCNKMSTVMCIHGESFQAVLSALGVTENFQKFCTEFLWRGLCGRCGLLGDHFTSECPLSDPSVKVFRRPLDGDLFPGSSTFTTCRRSSTAGTLIDMVASITVKADASEHVNRVSCRLDKKLRQFLLVQHLEWLEPALSNLGIVDLDNLHTVNMGQLRNELVHISDETLVLTEDAERALSCQAVDKFLKALHKQTGDVVSLNVGRSQHFIFLSHFKIEAGTEAALIRNELEKMIDKDQGSPANQFSCPIFLDSEDLTNLTSLQTRVRQSHNIALLLTKSVLSRPWVLVELATAYEAGVHVVPVLLLRGFDQFAFPDAEFYKSIHDGSLLGQSGLEALAERGIDPSNMEQAIRATFQRIAVPYSPHRPESIRQSEVQAILKHCRLKRAFLPDKTHKTVSK